MIDMLSYAEIKPVAKKNYILYLKKRSRFYIIFNGFSRGFQK